MTRMTIHEEAGIVQIDVEGHAMYNPGEDVVCAAISTLTYTLINVLQTMLSRGELNDLKISDSPGDIHIRIVKDWGYKHQWYAIRDFFITGMEMIAEHFPENLEVET